MILQIAAGIVLAYLVVVLWPLIWRLALIVGIIVALLLLLATIAH